MKNLHSIIRNWNKILLCLIIGTLCFINLFVSGDKNIINAETGKTNTYELLEYLESTGIQYIKTGITANTDTQWEIDLQFGINNDSQQMGTRRAADVNNQNRFDFGIYQSKFVVSFGNKWMGSQSYDLNRHTFIINSSDRSLSIDGNKVLSAVGTSASSTDEILIFNRNLDGKKEFTDGTHGKVYNSRIIKNGLLVQELIPARRISDNVLGMLDICTNKFYTNAGSGSFKAGPAISFKNDPILRDSVTVSDTGINLIKTKGVVSTGTTVEYAAIQGTDKPSANTLWNTDRAIAPSTGIYFVATRFNGTTLGPTYGPFYVIPESTLQDYDFYEYLQSSGTQYIDTGFKPNYKTRTILKAVGSEAQSHYTFVAGARNSKDGYPTYSILPFVGDTISTGVYSTEKGITRIDYGSSSTSQRTITLKNVLMQDLFNGFYVDYDVDNVRVFGGYNSTTNSYGKYEQVIITPDQNLQTECNFLLFTTYGGADNNKTTMNSIVKLSDCVMFNNGEIIRGYVPVKNKKTGKAGLLDLVNNKFYGNANTNGSDFSVGPKLDLTCNEKPEYELLDYIESTNGGKQYINTNFKPGNNTRTILRSSGAQSSHWSFVGGARTAVENGGTAVANSYCFLVMLDDSQPVKNKLRADYGGTTVVNTNFPSILIGDLANGFELDYNKNNVTLIANGKKDTINFTNATFKAVCPMTLFAVNNSNVPAQFSLFKLNECIIYNDDDSVARRLVPARRIIDGEIGLIDLANKANGEYVFYANSGSGVFQYGSVSSFIKDPIIADRITISDKNSINLLIDKGEVSTGNTVEFAAIENTDVPTSSTVWSSTSATVTKPGTYYIVARFNKKAVYKTLGQVAVIKSIEAEKYEFLDYIRTDGTQWFDTELPTFDYSDYELDVKLSLNTTSNNAWPTLFGGYKTAWSSSSYGPVFSDGTSTSYGANYIGAREGDFAQFTDGCVVLKQPVTMKFRNSLGFQSLDYGDKHYEGRITVPSGYTIINNVSPYLLNVANATTYPIAGDLYYATILDKGKVVRNFVPVIEKSTNKIGLIDLSNVSGTYKLFENINTSGNSFATGLSATLDSRTLNKYEFLDYIQLDGNQYIDTGHVRQANSKYGIEFKFDTFDLGSGIVWMNILGCDERETDFVSAYGNNSGYLFYGPTNNSPKIDVSLSAKYQQVQTADTTTKYNISFEEKTVIINGVPTQLGVGPMTLNKSNKTDWLGNMNIGDMGSQCGLKGKIYYSYIYDGDKLVRYFVPVRNAYTGEIGMLDLANKDSNGDFIFYANVGTGDFVAGEPLSPLAFTKEPELIDNSTVITDTTNLIKTLGSSNAGVLEYAVSHTRIAPLDRTAWSEEGAFIIEPGTYYVWAKIDDGSFKYSRDGSFKDNVIKCLGTISYIDDETKDRYEFLEYVKGDGTQYINTGVIPTANTDVEVIASFSDLDGDKTILGGGSGWNKNKEFCIGYKNGSGMYIEKGSSFFKNVATILADKKNTYTIFGDKVYVDDQYIGKFSSTEIDTTEPMYLFTINRTGQDPALAIAKAKAYSIKIWDSSNDELTNYFVPVKDRFTGKIGILDISKQVSGEFKFHGNAAAGKDLLAGPSLTGLSYSTSPVLTDANTITPASTQLIKTSGVASKGTIKYAVSKSKDVPLPSSSDWKSDATTIKASSYGTYYVWTRLSDGSNQYSQNGSFSNDIITNLGEVVIVDADTKDKYEFVDYISSTGTQYIDTKHKRKATSSYYMEFTIDNINPDALYINLFGSDVKDDRTDAAYALFYNSNDLIGYGINKAWAEASTPATQGTKNVCTLEKNIGILNGEVTILGKSLKDCTTDDTDWVGDTNICNHANQVGLIGKIYSFKIYDDGLVVRNMVPVKDIETEEYGLLDLSQQESGKFTFYGNDGTDDYAGGTALSYCTSTDPTISTDLVYKKTAQNLIKTNPSITGVTYKYAEFDDETKTFSDVETWSDSISETNAGDYYAFYKAYDGSNRYPLLKNTVYKSLNKVTIAKAPGVVNVPVALTPKYNKAAQTLIKAGSTTTVTGTMMYKVADSKPEDTTGFESDITKIVGTDAGTYKVWYYVAESADGNYAASAIADTPVQVTISKAAGVAVAPKANTLTYNSNSQQLIIAGEGTSTGTMMYKVASSKPSDTTGFESDITKIVGTDAGTYKVWYYVAESADGNYAASAITSTAVSVTINKADGVAIAPKANELTYNKTAQGLIAAGEGTPTGTMYYKVSSTKPTSKTGFVSNISNITGTNAGTYKVWYYVSGDDNHNATDISTTSVDVTIDKATGVAIAPNAKDLTYNKSALVLITAGTGTPTGTMKYIIASEKPGSVDGFDATINNIKATNAGIYKVYYYADESSNYYASTISETPVSVEIKKASGIAIAPKAKSLKYTGSDQVLIDVGTGTPTGTMMYAIGDSAPSKDSFTSNISNITGKDSKTYKVWYYAAESDDHNYAETAICQTPVSVTIGKDNMTVSSNDGSHRFDNTASDGGASVTVTLPSDNYTIKYGTTSGTYTLDDIPTYTNAGTYTVYYQVVDNNDNYNDYTGSFKIVIDKADGVAVAPVSIDSLFYRNKAQQLITEGDGDYTGTMMYKISDTKPTSTTGFTSTIADIKGTNAGTYHIWYYAAADSNHNETSISHISVDVTIAKANMTVNTTNGVDTYSRNSTIGADDSKASITVIEPLSGTVIKYSADDGATYESNYMPRFTEKGTYTVNYKIIDNNNNYNDYTNSLTITINPYDLANAVIDAVSDHEYEGTYLNPTVKVKGLTNNSVELVKDTEYEISWDNNEPSNESPYSAVQTLTVTPAEGNNNFINSKTFTYNEVRKKYSLSFNANGGTSVPNAIDKYYDVDISIPNEDAVRQHYTFEGWGLSNSATVADYNKNDTYDLNENKTLYALWKPINFTYTFYDEDGTTVLKQLEVLEGTKIVAPTTNPSKSSFEGKDYEFDGWYTEKTAGSKIETFPAITEETNYYARYKESDHLYEVKWLNYDGSTLATETYKFEEKPVYKGNTPTRTDAQGNTYVFKGWSPEITDDTKIIDNISYTATFKQAQTITINDLTTLKAFDTGLKVTARSNDPTGVLSYSIESGNSIASIDSSSGALTITGSGIFTVKVSATETDDYYIGTATKTFEVQDAITTIKINNLSKTYDGQPYSFSSSDYLITGNSSSKADDDISSLFDALDGYTILDYIESNGTQYLNTGVKGNEAYGIELDFNRNSTHTSDFMPYIGSATHDNFSIGTYTGDTGLFLRNKAVEKYASRSNVVATNTRHKFIIIDNEFKIDNKVMASNIEGPLGSDTSLIYVFSNSVDAKIGMKLYSLKMYGEKNELIRDFIPVINPSGIVGLFDLVNKEFHQSVSGNFIAGNKLFVSEIEYYSDSSCKNKLTNEPTDVGTYYVKRVLPRIRNYQTATSNIASLTITKQDVEITGIDANDKVYDGNTNATITGTAKLVKYGTDNEISLDDDINIDSTNAKASFASSNAGEDIDVTFTGYSLIGNKIDNYNLVGQPDSAKANITKAKLSSFNLTMPAPAKNVALASVDDISSKDEQAKYTISDLSWSSSEDDDPLTDALGETTYTATITLNVSDDYKNNYEFNETSSATVNGSTATINSVSVQDNELELSLEFDKTAKKEIDGISIKTAPTNVSLAFGDVIDLSGLEINVFYDDGTPGTVSFGEGSLTYDGDGRIISGSSINQFSFTPTTVVAGDNTITVTFAGMSEDKSGNPATFIVTIGPTSIEDTDHFIITDIVDQSFSGDSIKPSVNVTWNNGQTINYSLTEDDISLSYSKDCRNVGEKTITISGKGKFKGTRTIKYNIVPKLVDIAFTDLADYTYTGSPLSPEISIVEPGTTINAIVSGDKCTAKLINQIVNAGTWTAQVNELQGANASNYKLSKSIYEHEFTIDKAVLDKPELSKNIYVYSGSFIKPQLINYSDLKFNLSGKNSAKNIGVYSLSIEIKDTVNYEFDDSSTNATLYWAILAKDNSITVTDGYIASCLRTPTLDPDTLSAIQTYVGNQYSTYNSRLDFDITIYKQTGDEIIKISEAQEDITVTIDIPQQLLPYKNSMILLRTHNNDVSQVPFTIVDETKAQFKSRQFSTYSFIYTKSNNNNTPGNNSSTKERKYQAPNTGVE